MSVGKTLEGICVLAVFNSEISITQLHPGDFTLITIQIMPKPKECQLAYTAYLLQEDSIQSSTPAELIEEKCLKFQFPILFVTV